MPEAVWWVLTSAAAAALVVDQASKSVVRRKLGVDGSVRRSPICRLHHVENHNRGWLRMPMRWAVLLLSVIAAVALAAVSVAQVGVLTAIGIGLALGGAAGNLVDRLVRGTVTDFIAVGRWPVFNLADVALTVGVCVAPLGLL